MTNSEIIFRSSSDQGACISVLSTIEVDCQFNSKKIQRDLLPCLKTGGLFCYLPAYTNPNAKPCVFYSQITALHYSEKQTPASIQCQVQHGILCIPEGKKKKGRLWTRSGMNQNKMKNNDNPVECSHHIWASSEWLVVELPFTLVNQDHLKDSLRGHPNSADAFENLGQCIPTRAARKSWESPKTLQWSWYGPMNREGSHVCLFIFMCCM